MITPNGLKVIRSNSNYSYCLNIYALVKGIKIPLTNYSNTQNTHAIECNLRYNFVKQPSYYQDQKTDSLTNRQKITTNQPILYYLQHLKAIREPATYTTITKHNICLNIFF